MRTISIDCGKVATEEDFWRLYVQSTNPEGASYFGRNLDAFWDALAGGPGYPGECELRFINTDSIKSFRSGAFYNALKKIAEDCQTNSIFVE